MNKDSRPGRINAFEPRTLETHTINDPDMLSYLKYGRIYFVKQQVGLVQISMWARYKHIYGGGIFVEVGFLESLPARIWWFLTNPFRLIFCRKRSILSRFDPGNEMLHECPQCGGSGRVMTFDGYEPCDRGCPPIYVPE